MALASILLLKPDRYLLSVPDCSLPPHSRPVSSSYWLLFPRQWSTSLYLHCHHPMSLLPWPPATASGRLLMSLPQFCCLQAQWPFSNLTPSFPDLKSTGMEVSCLPAPLFPLSLLPLYSGSIGFSEFLELATYLSLLGPPHALFACLQCSFALRAPPLPHPLG